MTSSSIENMGYLDPTKYFLHSNEKILNSRNCSFQSRNCNLGLKRRHLLSRVRNFLAQESFRLGQKHRTIPHKEDVQKILKENHDSPVGGHCGVKKTYYRISGNNF
ncbi:hypothetical protein PV325_005828 [Microctonus aethiopoides]|nr:hypothetical protein PV325_005828 [Microctonus aethiopoides]